MSEALRAYGALPALGVLGRAHSRAELHHGLIEVSGALRVHNLTREIPSNNSY